MISNLVHLGKQRDHLATTPYQSLLRWLGGLSSGRPARPPPGSPAPTWLAGSDLARRTP